MFQDRRMFDPRAAVLIYTALFTLSSGEDYVEVTTKSGKVKGFTNTTSDGTEVDIFLGIPYAAPPTGQNRFAPPKEVEPWNGTLDATTQPRPCYQVVDPIFRKTDYISHLEETEDCLKLDIWVPKRRTGKVPVMFWIFGGGHDLGSIDLRFYDGSILAATENVIVVSANYRLSAFGFMYLGHPQAPGNVGLMDQAMGLQWVKNNIEAFGGDPERVTLFGESSGASSVGLQMFAPSSKDLFKNAILQSGTGAVFWSTFKPQRALATSLAFARSAGCPVKNKKIEEAVECLKAFSSEEFYTKLMDFKDGPVMFQPVVDGTFIPGDPIELLLKGKFDYEKNVLAGYNKEDGAIYLIDAGLETNEDSVYSDQQIRGAMKILMKYNLNLTKFQVDLVKYMYTDWEKPKNRIIARSLLIDAFTDRWFACGAIRTANKMADRGNKVFLYRFDHVATNDSFYEQLPRWAGSSHTSELAYVFGHVTDGTKNRTPEEVKLSKQVMRYWANFARNGDPNDYYQPTWPEYDSKRKLRLRLDTQVLTADRSDRLRECAFWDNIFPKTEPTNKKEL